MLKSLTVIIFSCLLISPTTAMWSETSCLSSTAIMLVTFNELFKGGQPWYIYGIGTGVVYVEYRFWYLFCFLHGPYALPNDIQEHDKCFDLLNEIADETKKIMENGIETCSEETVNEKCFEDLLKIQESFTKKMLSCKAFEEYLLDF